MGKNFYDQANDSDIKWHKEIRKITTKKGENYVTDCLLDCDYIKNHYRLTAVNMGKWEELDADPKAIQPIEFVEQLKNPHNEIVANESMFVLTIVEKNKEPRLKFSQGSVTVL